MNWLVFSYSLPAQSSSSPRVTLWRRLRRLGAISPAGGIYVLPARGECLEAFQWLAQEIRQFQGQAVVIHAQQFEGVTDEQMINLFHEARQEDYAEIETQMAALERDLSPEMSHEARAEAQHTLAKLQRQYADIARIDYFDSPEGTVAAAQLAKMVQALTANPAPEPEIKRVTVAAYKDRRWVTCPQPYIDRLACAWLIRRFINPEAVIRYSFQPEPEEVSFDMTGAEFGHTGNLCTFETMVRAFNLASAGLVTMAELIHEIDLRDERYVRPEAMGVEAILKGWTALNLSDAELEVRGVLLFDGLFETLSARAQSSSFK